MLDNLNPESAGRSVGCGWGHWGLLQGFSCLEVGVGMEKGTLHGSLHPVAEGVPPVTRGAVIRAWLAWRICGWWWCFGGKEI